jgi:hypothetical protein
MTAKSRRGGGRSIASGLHELETWKSVGEEGIPQCDKPHFTRDCKRFQDNLVEERSKVVKENNVCFKCLESWHALKDCAVEKKCGVDG